MSHYVDGYIIAVPRKKLAAYRRMATLGSKVWREHGALDYRECVADDVKRGKWTSFPRAVKLKPGETVVFAYIVFRSRADRDRVNKKAMSDPRLAKFATQPMPFDTRRFIWGGFKTLVAR